MRSNSTCFKVCLNHSQFLQFKPALHELYKPPARPCSSPAPLHLETAGVDVFICHRAVAARRSPRGPGIILALSRGSPGDGHCFTAHLLRPLLLCLSDLLCRCDQKSVSEISFWSSLHPGPSDQNQSAQSNTTRLMKSVCLCKSSPN